MNPIRPQAGEIHDAIAFAIERFAGAAADDLDKRAYSGGHDRYVKLAMIEAADAIREAGKSNATRRREARTK